MATQIRLISPEFKRLMRAGASCPDLVDCWFGRHPLRLRHGNYRLCIGLLRESFALSTRMEEVVVSVVLVGCMSGAIGGGSIADRIGRRSTLLWGGIILLLGSLLAAWSPNVALVIVARGLLGIAIGFTSVTAPVFVSELAPPQSRGLLIGLYQFALTIRIVLADLVGYWLAGQHAWRAMFGLGAVPAALFLMLVFTLPESPRWRMRNPC